MNPVEESPLLAIQTAVYTRLKAGLTGVAVYDYIPESASFPYVTIGETVDVPSNAHDAYGSDVLSTVHAWTKGQGGFAEVLGIARDIRALFDHQPMDLGLLWTVVSVRHSMTRTLRDPDPLVRHAPVAFRVTTEQHAA